jgi:RNA polymerase sigma-70 factor (ECF subfamily)
MYGICFHYTGNVDISKDLVHDGFIIIFTSIGSLRNPEKLESWMGRIMKNLSLKYLQQNKNIPIVNISEEQIPSTEDETQEVPLSYDVILSMIENLPNGYKNVFKLSVLDGLSHIEIAKALKIEPKSSSSQLFHARQQLKSMIANYRAEIIAVIRLLIIPLGYFFLSKHQNEATTPARVTATHPSQQPQQVAKATNTASTSENAVHSNNATGHNIVGTFTGDISQTASSKTTTKPQRKLASTTQAQEASTADTLNRMTGYISAPQFALLTVKTANINNARIAGNYRQQLPTEPVVAQARTAKSSHGDLSFSSIVEQATNNLFPQLIKSLIGTDTGGGEQRYITTWQQYFNELNAVYGHDGGGNPRNKALIDIAKGNIASGNSGTIYTKREFDKPLTLGLHFSKKLNSRWNIETGLRYTLLTTKYTTGDDSYIKTKQKVNYLGIPLGATYTFMRYKRLRLYGGAGMGLDIPFKATSKTDYVVNGNVQYTTHDSISMPKLQWSINGNIGVGFKLLPHTELYFSPGLRYYFNNHSKTETLWQHKPLQLSFPIGIRFNY